LKYREFSNVFSSFGLDGSFIADRNFGSFIADRNLLLTNHVT
jgi:hypothetical protein